MSSFDPLTKKGRRDEGRALHERYYALHPESGVKLGARNLHYVDAAGGYVFRVKDVATGTMLWRQPRHVTQGILAAHPPGPPTSLPSHRTQERPRVPILSLSSQHPLKPGAMLQLTPAPNVNHALARRGEAPAQTLYVAVERYGYIGPRQKRGELVVRGLSNWSADIARVTAAIK